MTKQHMTKRCWTVILTGVALAAVTPRESRGAPAQEATMPNPIAFEEEVVTVPVTVEDIDKKARSIVARAPDGTRSTVKIPEDVQGFDRLKKGDKIDLSYYRAVAVSVIPGGSSAATAAQQKSDVQRASSGHSGARPVTTSATVTSANKSNGAVEIKGPNGKVHTVTPQDSAVQKNMQGLKPGDVIQIVYTEAVATALRPSQSR
jgi:hypothetical protein